MAFNFQDVIIFFPGSNSNGESYIVHDRSAPTDVTREGTPGILDCTKLRPYWITWNDGNVELGVGDFLYEDTMVEWEDNTPHPVTAISLSGGPNLSPGSWEFSRDAG